MILDKKSKKELNKHKENFYKDGLEKRNINIFEDVKLFNVENKETYSKSVNILKVNIKKFSGFEGHYYFSGKDPLVNTAIQLLENMNLKPKESFLYQYYLDFQPKTYGEVYHLKKNNKLHQIESTNHFHPWVNKKPTNKFRAGLFGPKDITNVEHRIIRLKNIISNIREFGYIPSDDDIIEGYILLKKDDYRFLITGGHHRVAVMTAMNMNNKDLFNDVIVKYEINRSKVKVVNENEVDSWPGVNSGFINKSDALEMFNRYF